MATQVFVPIEQSRRALERVTVLVGVGRDGGDAGQAEVEDGDVVAQLLAPRQDEAAEAAVGVEADAALARDLAELLDRQSTIIVPLSVNDVSTSAPDITRNVGAAAVRGLAVAGRFARAAPSGLPRTTGITLVLRGGAPPGREAVFGRIPVARVDPCPALPVALGLGFEPSFTANS